MWATKLILIAVTATIAKASGLHPVPHAFAPAIAPAIGPAFASAFGPAFAPAPIAPAFAPAIAPAFAPAFAPVAFGSPPVSLLPPPVFKPQISFAFPTTLYKPHYHLAFATPILKSHSAYPVLKTYASFAPVFKTLHVHKTLIPPAPHFKSFSHYAPSFGHSHFL